jgi:hypothetical protein
MMLQNFNTNTSAILQGITMTSLALRPSGHREYLDRHFFIVFSRLFSMESVEKI